MAALRERLVRAAEDDLAWERRADFDSTQDDAVATVGFTQAPAPSGGTTISTQESAEVAVTSSAPRIAARDSAGTPWTTATPTQDGAPGYRGGVPCKVFNPDVHGQHVYDPAAWIHKMARHPASADGRTSAFLNSIPRITLPTYGSREEWPRWIGLFKALVHDQPSLTDNERITLLQSSLAGPAAQSVSGMLYTGALYGKALKTLQARFGREVDIVRAHLLTLFDAPRPRLLEPGEVERFQLILHNAVTFLKKSLATFTA